MLPAALVPPSLQSGKRRHQQQRPEEDSAQLEPFSASGSSEATSPVVTSPMPVGEMGPDGLPQSPQVPDASPHRAAAAPDCAEGMLQAWLERIDDDDVDLNWWLNLAADDDEFAESEATGTNHIIELVTGQDLPTFSPEVLFFPKHNVAGSTCGGATIYPDDE